MQKQRGMSENNLLAAAVTLFTGAKFADSSSIAMEPVGFRKVLERLLHEDIYIKVFTMDRHPSIRKLMREEYPNIIHQFDPWHVAKG